MDEKTLPDRTRRMAIDSASIKLADGNLWGMAIPTARLKPRVIKSVDLLGRPIETIQVETEYGYPLEIRRLIDDLRTACNRGTAEPQFEALFRLAVALVRRVHELDLEEAARLLEMGLEDLPEFIATVLSVVTGESLENDDSSPKRETNV